MPVVVFGMVPTDHSYCIKKQCDIKYYMYHQKGKNFNFKKYKCRFGIWATIRLWALCPEVESLPDVLRVGDESQFCTLTENFRVYTRKKKRRVLHNWMALMYKIVGKIYNNRSKESIVEALQNWRLFLIVLGAGKNLKGGSKKEK